MNKEDLKALLQTYDDAYYNNDKSLISDYEYDAIKNEYIEKYGEYDYVPGEASKNSKKFNHTTNVSSLDKLQISDEEGIRSNIERLWPIVIQPKMDGLTLVTYRNGDSAIHVTRGNGHVGEIVTEKAIKVDGIGETMIFPIRSEVVMLHSEFNRINQERVQAGLAPFENCRNAAAGMLRRNEIDKVEGLKAFAYNMLFEEQDPDYLDEEEESEVNASAQTQIDALKLINWNTVDSYIPKDIDDAMEYIMNYDRTVLDYDIDGLVVKHNGPKQFGETAHHPLNAIAIKFAPEGGWTTLRNIEWNTGRTGKTVPKAIFDPIYILGSEVKAATLHNFGIVKAHGLENITFKGKHDCITEVFVIKANDVIPAITEIRVKEHDGNNIYVQRIYEPEVCPDCGSKLRKEKDQLFCDNESCGSRVLNRLIHLAGRDYFNIEDLGEETAIKLIALYKQQWKNIGDNFLKEFDPEHEKKINLHPSFIYTFSVKDLMLLDGFAEKSANKLYDEIQNSKKIYFDKFLAGCGIPLVGRRAAKDIAEFYYTGEEGSEIYYFAEDYANGFEKLKTLKGIGKETITNLLKYYESYLIPFGECGFTFKDVIPKKKATNQMTFVITGEFEIARKEITTMIEEAGHKVSGSVSSKTSYLLAAPGEEGTSKYKKAIEVGTTIINSLEKLKEII